VFRLYGKALLDHMPENGILVIRGDMPHTTTHYLQLCEGYRPDVKLGAYDKIKSMFRMSLTTVVSIPLMSNEWYTRFSKSWRRLQNVTFPGSYYAIARSKSKAFNLKQFFGM